jgi:hypothetical protein
VTDAGSDEFEWDYRNMMTSATIDSMTTDYEYDGDGVRVSKETTDYLYDRASGLPVLIDDETNAYLHDGGTPWPRSMAATTRCTCWTTRSAPSAA